MVACKRTCLSDFIHKKIHGTFAIWGLFVGRRPLIAVVIGVAIALSLSAGVFNLEINSDNDLFTPHKLQGYVERELVEGLFGASVGRSSIVLFAADDILKSEILQEIWDYDRQLQTLSAGKGASWNDVCKREFADDECSVTSCFLFLPSTVTPPEGNFSQQSVLTSLSFIPEDNVNALIGGVKRDSNGIVSANAIMLVYATDESDAAVAWEERIFANWESYAAQLAGRRDSSLRMFYYNAWGADELSSAMISQEYPLMGGTIGIILLYMCIVLGGKPLLRSRLLLGLSCLVTVVAAMGVAFGIAGYAQIPFTILSPLLTFILLGVGVDDMIIILDCFQAAGPKTFDEDHRMTNHEEIALRMSQGLADAGYAITLTSITSFVAFEFASLVDFPAIRYFCQVGGLGILGVYILQITFFAGLVVLDERRVYARRYDCLCCFQARDNPDSTKGGRGEIQNSERAEQDSDGAGQPQKESVAEEDLKKQENVLDKLIGVYLFRCLNDARVQAAVIIAFLALAGVAAYGVTGMGVESDVINFYDSKTFLVQYFNANTRYFGARKATAMFVIEGDVGYEYNATRAAVRAVLDGALAAEHVQASPPVTLWLDDFDKYILHTNQTDNLTTSTFYPMLDAFFKADSFLHQDTMTMPNGMVVSLPPETIDPKKTRKNLLFNDDGRIVASRMSFQVAWSTSSSARMQATKDLRALVPSVEFPPLDVKTLATRGTYFVYSEGFSSADRDETMVWMIFSNLLFSAAGVVGVLFLLIDPVLVILISFCILLIDIDLLGLMRLWGMPLDIAAFIVLAMAIGLSVDYVVHIAHAFLSTKRHVGVAGDHDEDADISPSERLREALSTMGSSVFNGGMSTFLGICLLSLAKSPAFRTVFKVLFGTVLFGLLHGLIFAPVVLTVFSNCCYKKRKGGRGKDLESLAKVEMDPVVEGSKAAEDANGSNHQEERASESEVKVVAEANPAKITENKSTAAASHEEADVAKDVAEIGPVVEGSKPAEDANLSEPNSVAVDCEATEGSKKEQEAIMSERAEVSHEENDVVEIEPVVEGSKHAEDANLREPNSVAVDCEATEGSKKEQEAIMSERAEVSREENDVVDIEPVVEGSKPAEDANLREPNSIGVDCEATEGSKTEQEVSHEENVAEEQREVARVSTDDDVASVGETEE